MEKVTSYNFILPIVEKMNEVLNLYPDKEIIWFGRDNYVPVMNTYLLRYNKHISMVIDNDKDKWGREVPNYYPVKSNSNNEVSKQIPEIFIKSPDTIKDISKKAVVFLASKYEDEMVKQLRGLGISEEFIYTFPTEEEECIL